ncbi:MAG: hypothetical protein ACFCU4_07845 [Puniceicoccaceae bacterium]
MSVITDEETGDQVGCIFCGSTDDCPHLVGIIDLTFAECHGGVLYEGVDSLKKILEDKILTRLKAREKFKAKSASYEVLQMAKAAKSCYDRKDPDDVWIDNYQFIPWIKDILIDSGGEEPMGYLVEEGGPGMSSTVSILYAENPQDVLESAREAVKKAVENL